MALKSTNKIKLLFVKYIFSRFLQGMDLGDIDIISYEPPHGKTNNLHMRKQRRRSASR